MPSEWILLSYRLPREPSTPRIALWRRLRRLGVAQVSDGLVALPSDARTREQLEWAADHVVDHGGEASLWTARPATDGQERALAEQMSSQRAQEYREVAGEARTALHDDPADARRALLRLRRRHREVARRDFFPPAARDEAAASLRALEAHVAGRPATSGATATALARPGTTAAAR
ncbi:Chromate resistance protein ChrB [Cellulomonas fimi]|uniref:Chromate resistance protein ChrB n=1 Tax=Cellulomonas fimi TaxID=1708 RepID=UPI0002D70517|nr:Chromate resistance protein ChrB [Cellulomonas fimi]